eukprot:CAMPEP_0179273900 /NCGR_PEP_ID=MMETSP0797-20121207/33247_1 /TAXON_ID=47934 /ORGANISM="Dinophysis acuminata, Strain DAEP01" /LENGTH=124 /DNA_ID=CAMNT_0020982333 /DNA_START=138 /DNA_END=508 /DNA_ORIENTATION=+
MNPLASAAAAVVLAVGHEVAERQLGLPDELHADLARRAVLHGHLERPRLRGVPVAARESGLHVVLHNSIKPRSRSRAATGILRAWGGDLARGACPRLGGLRRCSAGAARTGRLAGAAGVRAPAG